MKIYKKDLLEVLEKVSPGLAKKVLVLQSGSFVFKNGMVITYNDNISIRAPFDLGFTAAVDSKDFYGYLKSVEAPELTIELNESTGEILFNSKNKSAGIRADHEITLPIEAVSIPEEFHPIGDGFLHALFLCSFSASKDRTGALCALHVSDKGFVESCDNVRATRVFFPGETVELVQGDFLIPAYEMSSIYKHNPTEYLVDNGWVHFRDDSGVVYSLRTLSGSFPNTEPLFISKGETVDLPGEFDMMVKTCSLFSSKEESTPVVTVKIEKNKILVSAEKETAWIKELHEIDQQEVVAEFCVNPIFLAHILKITKTVEVGDSTLLFSTENFQHVVSLIKP